MFNKELSAGVLGVVLIITLTIFYGFQYANQGQNANSIRAGLSLTEIQRHNSINDCWVIISGNVYDVTAYVNLHPGGATRISSFCGGDMTQAFLGQRHSSLADQQHAMMLLGTLNGPKLK
jgi:L-lactate dehydrogenase (cytochrome)